LGRRRCPRWGSGGGEGGRQRVVFPEAKPFSGARSRLPFKTGPARSPLFPYAGSNGVKDGSRLAGCSRKQCILPPLFFEAESNLCSSTPLFPEGRPLFSEAGSNLYSRIFCYAKQATKMHSSPFSSGWKQYMPAHPRSGSRLPFKPGSARSPLFAYPGSNSVKDGSRLAGCSRKQRILPPFFLEAGSNLCSSIPSFSEGRP